MSENTSNDGIRKPLEWIKESGLLAVTVAGLALYFFLSIPATLFYSQLGTTPEEVGINYVNLLSGSTYELLVISIALASAILLGGFILATFLMLVYTYPIAYIFPISRDSLKIWRKRTGPEWATRAFDNNLKLYRHVPEAFQTRVMFWPNFPKTLPDLETAMERRQELLMILDPTPEQSAELEHIESQLSFPKEGRRRKQLTRNFVTFFLIIRHHSRQLAASFTLIIVIIVLPLFAFIQATQVRDGHTYFANDTGIFDYSADPVDIYPVTPNSATTVIFGLKKEKLFLLGQNAVYAVLYSPVNHATIRIPITSVIIISVRS